MVGQLLAEYELIDTLDALHRMAASFNGIKTLAVDLEADSMYHFKEKICLIQLSDGKNIFLVDPLKVADLSCLTPFFADKNVVKVMHGADYDIRSLHRDYEIEVRNLFDTQIACRFLGMNETGLEAVVSEIFNVKLNKNFQKKDWSQRPLPLEMLQYAAGDVSHLHALMEVLEDRLRKKRRLTWTKEECALLCKVRCPDNGDDPLYLRFKGAGRMDRNSLCVLEALLRFRQKVAEKKDKPVFKVMSGASVTKLTAVKPTSLQALKETKAVSPKQSAMYGKELVNVIRKAAATPRNKCPVYPRRKNHRPSTASPARFKRLKEWRDQKAGQIQLDGPVLFNKALMTEIAAQNPKSMDDLKEIRDMRTWQRRAFGREILLALKKKTNQ